MNYDNDKQIIINDIVFYYNPNEIQLTKELIELLEEFTIDAEDEAYSICYDPSAGIYIYQSRRKINENYKCR